MKKLSVALVAALFAGTAFGQSVLTLSVTDDGGMATATVSAEGEVVNVEIHGVLSGDASDGLALFGVNMTNTGSAAMNLAGPNFVLAAPAGDVANFDRNLGVTNPPGPVPGPTGFGGTDDGNNGLLQIGGGQNTIGNTGPALYPVGPVATGVAIADTVLAEGSFTVPVGATEGDEWILTLDTGFANVIDLGQAGPVYNVTAANVVIGGELTITFAGGVICPKPGSGGACPQCDLNENGTTDGLDIAAITNSSNFGLAAGAAADPCADVDGSGIVSGLDVSACTSSACFGL